MQVFRAFSVCLITALLSVAQPPSPDHRSVALTHICLNSADPSAAIAFWKDIIGTSTYTRGSLNGVSTLGVLLVFTGSAPSGPSAGSVIDHLGFRVPDLQPFVDKLAKTSFKSFRPGDGVLMIDGPDGVRIELTEDNSMYPSLEFGHIHFHTAQPNDMQAWYDKYLGARPNTDDPLLSSRLPGATLDFAQADSALPSAGRAIDNLSFETGDLESFRKALLASGIKVDASPSSMPAPKAVLLTDPWGTRIEVTEAVAH